MQKAIFGRGQRTDLDDDEAEELIRIMRVKVAEEWERSFPSAENGRDVGGSENHSSGQREGESDKWREKL